jgi:RecQ family ATP-dependent DNA helicase
MYQVDQVAALEAYGIPVATINGTTPLPERKAIIEDLLSGHPKTRLLYVTPEFCCTETFRRNLIRIHAQGELNRVAIDEAHCISEWGHDFRPAYKELSWFRKTFTSPLVPITALTATATPKVRDDIVNLMGLDRSSIKWFHTPSARPNIHYEVRYIEGIDDDDDEEGRRIQDLLQWLDFVRSRHEIRHLKSSGENSDIKPPPISGIVYVPMRSVADELALLLSTSNRDIHAVAYHAGLPPSERKRIQKMWASKEPPDWEQPNGPPPPAFSIVVATNAFGMGIDNPHVRFVVHWTPPRSFEGLVQESGRAGRDGRAAVSIIYYNRTERDRVFERFKKDENPRGGTAHYRFTPQSTSSKARSLKARVESFGKVIAFCEATDRCRHQIIKEFSGDLELEEIMSSQTTCHVSSSSSPCDFACDVCKYGTENITRHKNDMLKLAQLEAAVMAAILPGYASFWSF